MNATNTTLTFAIPSGPTLPNSLAYAHMLGIVTGSLGVAVFGICFVSVWKAFKDIRWRAYYMFLTLVAITGGILLTQASAVLVDNRRGYSAALSPAGWFLIAVFEAGFLTLRLARLKVITFGKDPMITYLYYGQILSTVAVVISHLLNFSLALAATRIIIWPLDYLISIAKVSVGFVVFSRLLMLLFECPAAVYFRNKLSLGYQGSNIWLRIQPLEFLSILVAIYAVILSFLVIDDLEIMQTTYSVFVKGQLKSIAIVFSALLYLSCLESLYSGAEMVRSRRPTIGRTQERPSDAQHRSSDALKQLKVEA